jgi:hypothetical protein
VIKTSLFKYKPLKQLSADERSEYVAAKEAIQSQIKMMKTIDWKMTNHYLQIAQMKNIQDISLTSLKKRINEEVILISSKEIDQIKGG